MMFAGVDILAPRQRVAMNEGEIEVTITIKTRLHHGIYASSGGGEDSVHYEFKTGPRNLIRAAKLVHEHRISMIESFGNVGHVRTWVEIDGREIRDDDLSNILEDDREQYGRDAPDSMIKTCTQKARELIG
jgi:hypothetical protein